MEDVRGERWGVSATSQVFAFTYWVISVIRSLTELRRPLTELSGPLTIVRRPLTETKKWLEEFVKGAIPSTFHMAHQYLSIAHQSLSHGFINTLHLKSLSCNALQRWWRVFLFVNHDKKVGGGVRPNRSTAILFLNTHPRWSLKHILSTNELQCSVPLLCH